jgi:transcriptional regulator with XRE-family HTH domain
MSICPSLCRAARALLNWSQQELATRAQVSKKTIVDYETSQVEPRRRTLRDVVQALESAGIEFLPAEENVSRGGLRLKWGYAATKKETGLKLDNRPDHGLNLQTKPRA